MAPAFAENETASAAPIISIFAGRLLTIFENWGVGEEVGGEFVKKPTRKKEKRAQTARLGTLRLYSLLQHSYGFSFKVVL